MASPFSGLVLGSGALLASPALWAAFVEGTLSTETAVVRLGVAIVVSWVGFSLLGFLLSGTSAQGTGPDAVPRALPGIDGPIPVRGAVLDSHDEGIAGRPGG
jgi:hypothetical protein